MRLIIEIPDDDRTRAIAERTAAWVAGGEAALAASGVVLAVGYPEAVAGNKPWTAVLRVFGMTAEDSP